MPSHIDIPRSRRGAISILGAVLILVLLGLIGLGIDTALVMTANQQLQRAADSIALAAANQLQNAQGSDWPLVRAKAIEAAALQNVIGCGANGIQLADNPTNAAGGSGRTDMLLGRWGFNATTNVFEFTRSNFATGLPRPNAVQVYPRCGDGTGNSALQLLFSPVFGATTTSDVGRSATAVLGPRDTPLILVLDPAAAGALSMNGSVTMDVEAGTVHVDSNNSCGIQVNGASGQLRAQRTRVVGGACMSPSNLTGDLITGSYYVPDPLASLATPSTSGMTNYNRINTGGNFNPGYYPNGISLTGGTVNLAPGLYVIGTEIDLRGNCSLIGSGVCLYLASGSFSTNGTASVDLTPPTSGVYSGVAYFQARTNATSSAINGGGTFQVRGTLYVPNATFALGGNASRTVGRFVVWRLDLSGNVGYVVTGLDVPLSNQYHVFLVK